MKTQLELVFKYLNNGKPHSIKEIADDTHILEPNIRRILGQGCKKGEFKRIARGVYTISKNSKQIAYIECGNALDVLPKLVNQNKKFDMIFLDPAYFSKALIGGNRKIVDYKFISSFDFGIAMQSIVKLIKNDISHIYLMLSGSPTAQIDMDNYYSKMVNVGLNLVYEGTYTKLYRNGKPVINLRGKRAAHERLILFTKSGYARKGEETIDLNFRCIRPFRKYKTEKSPELLNSLIKNSTYENEYILDCFAGSGVTGEEALKLNRNISLIEISKKAINEHIIPRLIN